MALVNLLEDVWMYGKGKFALKFTSVDHCKIKSTVGFNAIVLGDIDNSTNLFKSCLINYNVLSTVFTINGFIHNYDLFHNFTKVSEQEFLELHKKWKKDNFVPPSDPRKPVAMAEEKKYRSTTVDVAQGEELDALGTLYGLKRKGSMGEAETDADYRERIQELLTTPTVKELPKGRSEGDDLKDFFFPEAKKSKDQIYGLKCDCGLAASGSGGEHSDWCQIKTGRPS